MHCLSIALSLKIMALALVEEALELWYWFAIQISDSTAVGKLSLSMRV